MHSTRTQTYTRSDGSVGTSIYTVWTTKGVRFIISLYENDWNVKKSIEQINDGRHLQPIKHYLTKLVSPLVEGDEDVEWSTVVVAVKRQYICV